MSGVIPGWTGLELKSGKISHTVFSKGAGRGVVLMHELQGMTPECIGLGQRLVAAGYRVYMPLLFGAPQDSALLRNTVRLCISREILVFRSGKTSPVVDWLRVLCCKAWEECGGPGVGVIGMCLTGNFVIALLAEPSVIAPVTCQPALPVGFADAAPALAISASDLEEATGRAKERKIPLLGFRFAEDTLCRAEKFDSIRSEFGELFRANTLPGSGHCILTRDFVDRDGHPTKQALEKTLAFFQERLGTGGPSATT